MVMTTQGVGQEDLQLRHAEYAGRAWEPEEYGVKDAVCGYTMAR